MSNPRLDRLYRLTHLDQRSRRRFENTTIVIMFLYGAVNTLLLGRAEKQVTEEALVVVCAMTAVLYFRYCFQRSASMPKLTYNGDDWLTFRSARRPMLVRVAAIASGLLLIVARKGSIETLEAAVVEERLKRISAGKLTREKLRQADEISSSSRKLGIKVRPSLISELAQKCIIVAGTDSDDSAIAWNAAQSCISYRWFLISPSAPKKAQDSYVPPVSPSGIVSWDLYAARHHMTPDNPGAVFGPFPTSVTSIDNYCWSDTAAGMSVYELTNLDRNKSITNGPCGLRLNGNGGDLELDGLRVRHIIYNHLRLIYHGGPLLLEDVGFTDCAFAIDNNPAGRGLAEKLLRSNSITFEFMAPSINR